MTTGGTQVRKACYICFCVVVVLVTVALLTPNWIASDPRVYGAQFVKLGLWESCFRSFADPRDIYLTKYFVGCRWMFSEEYRRHSFISFLEQDFFVVVQIFYTFGFTILLIACCVLVALMLCCTPEKEVLALNVISILLMVAGICSIIAVITFGALGDGQNWLPDPDHNFLSWSFGLAVVGTFLEFVTSVLFWVEARIIKYRKQKQMNQQSNVFTLTSSDQQYNQTKA